MKLKKYLLFLLLTFFVGVGNVFALDEYQVEVSESGVNVYTYVTEYEEVNNNGTTETIATTSRKNITDYSSIIDYQDGVLTLKEGLHFSDIVSHVNLTITSNDKPVYVNYMMSTKNENKLVLTNLDMKAYQIDKDDTGTISYVSVGVMDIINSKIDLSLLKLNTANNNIIHSATADINISNSTIKIAGDVVAVKNLTITDSTIETLQGKDELSGTVYAGGVLKIEGSDVDANCKVWGVEDVFITNSSVTTKKLSVTSEKGYLNIVDSDIDAGVGMQAEEGIFMRLSDVVVKEVIISTKGNLQIENTNLRTEKGISAVKFVDIFDSVISIMGEDATFEFGDGVSGSTISNSTINTSCELESTGNLELIDSYITLKHNKEKSNSNIVVLGDLWISNSRIITESDSLPAVLVTGKLDVKDITNIKDKDGNQLEIVKVKASSENFLKSLENNVTTNSIYINEGDEVSTFASNGELVKNLQTEGFFEVTLKVVNGTWSDGSTDDIFIKVLIGEEYVYENLPNGMVANDGYKDGEWKSEGNGVYVYTFVEDPEYVENPNTGLFIGLIFSIISIIGFGYLFKASRKNSMFRRI